MQESHYMEAGPSTSRVKEVVEQPTPTPVTVIGGPLRAPVRTAAPISIASIWPSSITYSKAVTLPMQSVTGSSSTKAPFNIEKERMLLKKEPLRAMHKLVEEQDEAVDQVLGKHCKLMEFAKNSFSVQNAVALSSMLPEKPVEPLLQDSLPPAPAFKTMKEYNEHEKKCRNRTRKAKKAKKDSVHLDPSEMGTNFNVWVFPEVSSNLISETGEPLFLEENLKVFPNSPCIINPKHLHAKYFKALIESLNLDNDESYLNDPSLDMNHCTDNLSQVEYEEPLDWGTSSAQDDQSLSSDKDSIGNELAATAGISCLLLTPAPTRRLSHTLSSRSSKGKGKQREFRPFGGDDQDNNPDSHAYNDYGYNRLVSTNFTVCTLTNDKKSQLSSSLSSLESRVELFFHNKCSSNLSNCVKCKTHKNQDKIEIMADSGASNCFTHTQSNLTEFEVLNDNDLVVKTASKTVSLKITGKGA
jgi:hypothetical protein